MTVTLKIFLFEIQGKMLWLVHCRDSFVWNIMANSLTVTPEIHLFESCILPYYKVQFLNKRLCSMNCGWLKETFWQYVTIHGLDKYNTEMWREFFIRINLTLILQVRFLYIETLRDNSHETTLNFINSY